MQNADVVQWIAFVVLAALTLIPAIAVVADRNLFHGALWLLLSLFGVAGLFVLLAAPFLAAVQVLVYMGAIVILIIFAIMLTRRVMGARETVNDRWLIGAVMAVLAFGVITAILWAASQNTTLFTIQSPTYSLALDSDYWVNTVANLGKSLVDMNQYALPFELASLLLTGAMIGAIVIAREDISL